MDAVSKLNAALSGHYQIEREVGRGGMATVYRAQDLRHHRPVALKVLHSHLAESLGPERFLREIQIAGRLQHPHIVPMYDSGRADDLLYYVMPFVEGESLRQRLERQHRLPMEEAVQIARAVAAALDYAHRQQVVHRDIKPENVMMQDGEAVVTDFGIAKAVSASASSSLTQTGMAVGTPAYMSPEQASGEIEIDGRADVYSLGAMLYEMVTGSAPFTGPNMQAIMAKLFMDPVPAARDTRPDVPDFLDQAITKSLAKTPAARFATASQFAQALTWPSGMSTPPEIKTGAAKSIAVLAFSDMSPQHDQDFFCEGIAEEIINALSKVQALRVASRTSSFAFKGKSEDISEIGRKLKVATILEGSVRKAGDRLRVTAQLVNVADGYHLWSERFDRQLEDVFAIQDEIAGSIVKALRLVLSEDEKRAIEKSPTVNVQAYEYYLRGRQYFHQWSRTSIQYARRMFERAIEIEPEYALAYTGIADCCAFLYMYWDGSKSNLDGADVASRRALELDPNLAAAHASRGFALSLSRRYSEARPAFQRALQLDPKLFEAYYLFARACLQEGKLDEAATYFAKAAEVRPEDYQAMLLATGPLKGLGREQDAIDNIHRAMQRLDRHLELHPDDPRALYLGAGALMQLGQRDRALDWVRRAHDSNPSDSMVLYNVACVYALGGMKDEALTCLEKAVDCGFGHREWLENDSDLTLLRDEQRFAELQKRL
jgi:serine/threonine protein kinase/tetratricopeptide (TPR) repeat protein